MKVEMCLKELLQEYNLNKHGVETRIAEATGLHRHTIGKMIRNEMSNPSLEGIGKVCQWLTSKGVPPNTLPGALFCARAPELWMAMGNSQNLTIYLGEYRHNRKRREPVPMRRMIALHDAEVGSMIIREITKLAAIGRAIAVVNTRYLPFQFSPAASSVNGTYLETDIKRAIHLFGEVQNRGPKDSVIMLGSQRVNYLVECRVADLFGCNPFGEVKKRPRVPFYLCYRGFDRQVPSCFGGLSSPPGDDGDAMRGTYYIDEDHGWVPLVWDQKVQDAGIVIVIREGERVELEVIGFSGQATSALGRELIENPEKFWPEDFQLKDLKNPVGGEDGDVEKRSRSRKKEEKSAPTIEVKGREIGIYACRVTFCNGSLDDNHLIEDDFRVKEVEVIPLGARVLRRFLVDSKKGKK